MASSVRVEFHCSTSSVLGLSRKCTIIANGGHQSIFWPSKEPLSIYFLCFIPAHSASSLPAPTPMRSPTPLATYSREHEQSLLRARVTKYIHETKSDADGPRQFVAQDIAGFNALTSAAPSFASTPHRIITRLGQMKREELESFAESIT